MESNPSSPVHESGEAGWAPPPPVVLPGQRRVTPPPLPPSMRRAAAEAEFEATLGNLVNHYASLPPAEYGEAPEVPELVAVPQAGGSRRNYVWWGVGSLVLGAALAGGVITGLHLIQKRPSIQPSAPAVVPEVPISVKVAAPATEPLADESVPQTSALPDDPAPAAAAPAPAPTPTKRVVHHATRRPRATAATGDAPAKPHRASDEGGWEDPYK